MVRLLLQRGIGVGYMPMLRPITSVSMAVGCLQIMAGYLYHRHLTRHTDENTKYRAWMDERDDTTLSSLVSRFRHECGEIEIKDYNQRHAYDTKSLLNLRQSRLDWESDFSRRMKAVKGENSLLVKTICALLNKKETMASNKLADKYLAMRSKELKTDEESRYILQFEDTYNPAANPIMLYSIIIAISCPEVIAKGALTLIICALLEANRLRKTKNIPSQCAYREVFKTLTKTTFLASYKNTDLGTLCNLCQNIETAFGPSAYKDEDIEKSVREWVQGTTTWAKGLEGKVEGYMDQISNEWFQDLDLSQQGYLTFEQYCTDPWRYATTGGAPVVDGIRSKWYYSLSQMESGRSVYNENEETGRCVVALKEEVKTRCVITTPMNSYLRQSYLLYVLGVPKSLPSTISASSYLAELKNISYPDYVCIDAEKFDYQIPRWFIEMVYGKMKGIVAKMESSQQISPEIAADLHKCCDKEMDILNNLYLEYKGNVVCKYEKGLLSGWRFTTLIGSLASYMVVRYCLEGSRILPRSSMVQGDDIIIPHSKGQVTSQIIMNRCEEFGLIVNRKKTTSSQMGEFLKYKYASDRIFGLPARAVRSIFYRNPWLDAGADKTMGGVSKKWWTMMSRILVLCKLCTKIKPVIVDIMTSDLYRWSDKLIAKNELKEVLCTPTVLGGLGPIEMISPDMQSLLLSTSVDYYREGKINVIKLQSVSQKGQVYTVDDRLRDMLNYKNTTKNQAFERVKTIVKISRYDVIQFKKLRPLMGQLKQDTTYPSGPIFTKAVNATASILATLVDSCGGWVSAVFDSCKGQITDLRQYLDLTDSKSVLRGLEKLLQPERQWYEMLTLTLNRDELNNKIRSVKNQISYILSRVKSKMSNTKKAVLSTALLIRQMPTTAQTQSL